MTRDEFDREFLRERADLLSYAWGMTRNREDAEDLVSEVYIRCAKSCDALRGDLMPFLFRCARNKWRDMLRAGRRRPSLVSFEDAGCDGGSVTEIFEDGSLVAADSKIVVDDMRRVLSQSLGTHAIAVFVLTGEGSGVTNRTRRCRGRSAAQIALTLAGYAPGLL